MTNSPKVEEAQQPQVGHMPDFAKKHRIQDELRSKPTYSNGMVHVDDAWHVFIANFEALRIRFHGPQVGSLRRVTTFQHLRPPY